MTARARIARPWIALAVCAAAAGAAPWFAGSAAPPSAAASAAQLLPPGTRVLDARLLHGGFVRARDVQRVPGPDGGSMCVLDGSGWRDLPLPLGEEPAPRTMWLGTDQQGRDVAARVAQGARTSLVVAVLATLLTLALGASVGLARAFGGRLLDHALALVTDALLGLPRLLVLLALGLALARGPAGLAFALALGSWMEAARLVAGAARGHRAATFVEAARAQGATPLRIAVRHVAPQLVPLGAAVLPVIATEAVLLEATLGYLGAGGASSSSWGRLVADGQRLLPAGWWIALVPGLLLAGAAGLLALAGRRAESAESRY